LQYAAISISEKYLGEVLQSICGPDRYLQKQAMVLVAEGALSDDVRRKRFSYPFLVSGSSYCSYLIERRNYIRNRVIWFSRNVFITSVYSFLQFIYF
jgi:hypothetical protein